MRPPLIRSRTRPCRALCAAACVATLSFASALHAEPSDLPPEVGYNYGEIETPRIAAMGGALRGFSSSLDALFLNPANMASTRVYHIGVTVQIWPEANRQSYGAGAVDSIVSSTHLAGGFGGTWTLQDPDGVDRQAADLRFALAFPFSEQFFLGAGGRFLWLQQDGLGPLGPSLASGGLEDEQIVRGFALDAGATLRPAENFGISVVGNNLNNPGHSFQPTSFGGAIGYGSDFITVEGDVLADFTTWDETTLRAMVGFEVVLAETYPLRAGYRYDEGAATHSLSLGAGYVDRALAAEVAVRREIIGDRVAAGNAATAIVLGFRYHLESTGLTASPEDTF
jgi:hypothetical protein